MVFNPDETADHRKARRFTFEQLAGIFNGCSVRILNLSQEGVQIEHTEPMKIGAHGKLRILGEVDGERIELRIRLVWSRLLQATGAKAKTFQSGGRFEEELDQIAGRLGRLIRAHGQLDSTSMARKLEIRRQREEARRIALEELEPVDGEEAALPLGESEA